MSQIVGAPEAFDWLELAMMRLLAVFVSLHDADETATGFDGLLDRCSGQMDEIMSQVVDAWARLISDDASLPMIQKALIALAERRVAAASPT